MQFLGNFTVKFARCSDDLHANGDEAELLSEVQCVLRKGGDFCVCHLLQH